MTVVSGLKKILAALGFNLERWATHEARRLEMENKQRLLEACLQKQTEELELIRRELTCQRLLFEQAAADESGLQQMIAHNESLQNVRREIAEIRELALDISGRFPLTEAGRRENDLRYQDLLLLLSRLSHFIPDRAYTLETDYPVSLGSNDHKKPWGTKNDNTRSPRFVAACEKHYPGEKLRCLDLGCSGGGLVLDFLLKGHEAVGLEGSDYSLKAQRAEWRLLAGRNLFTADITRSFQLSGKDKSPFQAQIVSAWEFMEHIAEQDLPAVFENIGRHLEPGGLFIGSISVFDDVVDGVSYHPTVKPRAWWAQKFAELDFPFTGDHFFDFHDFCRGTGNGYFDGDYSVNPDLGFHFVARRADKAAL